MDTMFVRKGTVRKVRSGSNRRSARRPRRDSNSTSTGGTSRKSVVSDEPSSSSIGHRLTPNGDSNTLHSTSNFSLAFEEDIKDSVSVTSAKCSMYELQNVAGVTPNTGSLRHQTDTLRYQNEIAKPSPAKSRNTTVVVSSDFVCVSIFTNACFPLVKQRCEYQYHNDIVEPTLESSFPIL